MTQDRPGDLPAESLIVSVVRSRLDRVRTAALLANPSDVSPDALAVGAPGDLESIAVCLTVHPSTQATTLAARLVAKRVVERGMALAVTFTSPQVERPSRLGALPLDAFDAVECLEVRVAVLTNHAALWLTNDAVHVLGPLASRTGEVLYGIRALADPTHCEGDRQLIKLVSTNLTDAIESLRAHSIAVLRAALQDDGAPDGGLHL